MDTIFKGQKVSQNKLKSKLFNAEIKRKIIFSFITILLIVLPVSCTNNLTPSPTITTKVDSGVNTNDSVANSTQKKVSSINLLPLNFYASPGEEINIVGSVKYSDGTTSNKIVWFSSDLKLATIDDNGRIKAISPGKVKITATSAEDVSVTTTTDFTVNNVNGTPAPSSILDPKGVSKIVVYSSDGHFINDSSIDYGYRYNIQKDTKIELVANVIYNDGTSGNDLNWTTTTPMIINVSKGVVYSLNKGNAWITITSNQDKKKSVNVNFNIYDINPCGNNQTEQYSQYWYGNTATTHPTGDIETSGITERATFTGKVYDANNVPVDGVKVNAKSIDPCISWVGEEQVTVGGAYLFRNAPVGSKVEIVTTKDGWASRSRTEFIKSNLTGDPKANLFDFSGMYAIQDEPEITSIKINGKQVFGSGPATKPNKVELATAVANISGLDNSNLTVEAIFSEPVNKVSFESNIRIISQTFNVMNNQGFIFDKTTPGVSFIWSDDRKYVSFKTNKAILANKDGSEARYMIDLAFKDDSGKAPITGKYIRFTPVTQADYIVFSLANDMTPPKLLNIMASDGGIGNDYVTLTFSEPMDITGTSSLPLILMDSEDPSNVSKQRWGYETYNVGGNNATVLGYNTNSGFKTVYMIGKLVPPITVNSKLQSLFGSTGLADGIPSKSAMIGGKNAGFNVLKLTNIYGNTVALHLSTGAINPGEIIVISVCSKISGKYIDSVNGINIDLTTNPDSNNINFANITDPAGNLLSTGEGTTSANIDVNNSQRVIIAI